MKLQFPNDFKKIEKIWDGYNSDKQEMDLLMETISIDLTSNFDIRASIDFEFDQGLFELGMDESVKDEDGSWVTEVSHEQSPLIFKQNNDRQRTMRRELVADNVESGKKDRRHTLMIANREPNFLHLLDASRGEACLYVTVKIYIKATQKDLSSMFALMSRNRGSRVAPMLTKCRPDESPVFLHGRPETVSFNIIFNTQPYLKHHSAGEKADPSLIRDAMRMKTQILSLETAEKTEVMMIP